MTNCSWLLLKSLQVPLAAEAVTTSFCCSNLWAFFWKNAAATVSPVTRKMHDGREKYTEGGANFHDAV